MNVVPLIWSPLIAASVAALIPITVGEWGSCAAAKKCCDGQDLDCMAEVSNAATPHYGADEYEETEPCYCDNGCLEVGDCCPDFKEYCGVIDCQVSGWAQWSNCDVSCGIGTSTRTREVTRPEANGGEKCPALQGRKECRGTKCSKRLFDKISALKETAMLLPGKYARRYMMHSASKYEVRSNLKTFNREEKEKYCVVFEVGKATRGCLKSRDTSELFRGNSVCVVCTDRAQRDNLGGRCSGHGVPDGKRTRFKNLLNPSCHGRWTRIKIEEGNNCPCAARPYFTFV